MIQWKALIRDAIIVLILTFLGGFVIGIASAGRAMAMEVIGISNMIFMIVGFTVSGCIAKVNRFRHLLHVAVAVWLLSVFNVLFYAIGLGQWLLSIVAIVIAMLIGGGVSYIFVRTPKEEHSQQSDRGDS